MQVLQYFDYIFTGIFTIEIAIKVSSVARHIARVYRLVVL